EDDRIRDPNEAFEALLPRLAGKNVLLVEIGRVAAFDQRDAELLGEGAIPARIGNEHMPLHCRMSASLVRVDHRGLAPLSWLAGVQQEKIDGRVRHSSPRGSRASLAPR